MLSSVHDGKAFADECKSYINLWRPPSRDRQDRGQSSSFTRRRDDVSVAPVSLDGAPTRGKSQHFLIRFCGPGAVYDLTGNTDPRRFDEASNRTIICATTTDGRRLVLASVKRMVLSKYRIAKPPVGSVEIDHIVDS